MLEIKNDLNVFHFIIISFIEDEDEVILMMIFLNNSSDNLSDHVIILMMLIDLMALFKWREIKYLLVLLRASYLLILDIQKLIKS